MLNKKERLVLGIDPGYERMGVAIVGRGVGNKELVFFSDCITTSKNLEHSQRIATIANEVEGLIRKFQPDTVALESLFFNNNHKTAMKVSEARGAILSCVSKMGVAIEEFTPLQVKIATTGYGRADKNQVIDMVKKLTGIKKLPKFDDEFDAIAVAITCLASANIKK